MHVQMDLKGKRWLREDVTLRCGAQCEGEEQRHLRGKSKSGWPPSEFGYVGSGTCKSCSSSHRQPTHLVELAPASITLHAAWCWSTMRRDRQSRSCGLQCGLQAVLPEAVRCLRCPTSRLLYCLSMCDSKARVETFGALCVRLDGSTTATQVPVGNECDNGL